MSVEDARTQLRDKLETMFGVHEAAILMDRPPGGWSDLATNRSVDALASETGRRFDAMAADMDRRFDAMAADMDRRFDAVDRRFVELEERFDLKLGALEDRILGAMDRGFRGQTWRLVTATTALMGIFAAALRL